MTAGPPHAKPLPLLLCIGWGAGTFVTSVLLYTTNTLLLRYLVDYVGIAAAIAGTLIALSKIVDAVVDPVIGVATDRTRSRWGRRRPYLLIGTLLCALVLPLMFSIPSGLGGSALIAYVAGVLVLYAVAWSLFNIPYLAMPAEMTDDPRQRSRLIVWRVYASGLSVFLGSSAAPFLLQWLGRTREAHLGMALALAPFVLGGGLLAFFATRRARMTSPVASSPVDLRAQFDMLAGNPALLSLIVAKFVMLAGVTVQGIVAAYFTTHVLRLDDYTLGAIFMMSTIGLLASQPLWLALGRRHSKRAVYTFAAALNTLAGLTWLMAAAGDPYWLALARALLAGACAGGLFLMSNSMLPDAVEQDHRRTGLRREGNLVALFAFAEQTAAALAAGIVGWMLGALGFISATQGSGAQSDTVVDGIRLLYALAPAATLASAACLVWFRLEPARPASLAPVAGKG